MMSNNKLFWESSLIFCLLTSLSFGQQIKQDSTQTSSAGNVIIMSEPPREPGGWWEYLSMEPRP